MCDLFFGFQNSDVVLSASLTDNRLPEYNRVDWQMAVVAGMAAADELTLSISL